MDVHDSNIYKSISSADDRALSRIVLAVIARYQELFPEEEVIFLSLPRSDPEERESVLHHAVELLKHT